MKENRMLWKLSGHRPSQLTEEHAEQSFLCVPLRNPLRLLRFENSLRNPTARLIKLSALVITLIFFRFRFLTIARDNHRPR